MVQIWGAFHQNAEYFHISKIWIFDEIALTLAFYKLDRLDFLITQFLHEFYKLIMINFPKNSKIDGYQIFWVTGKMSVNLKLFCLYFYFVKDWNAKLHILPHKKHSLFLFSIETWYAMNTSCNRKRELNWYHTV